jgi:heterodisulfide reductase subunit B
VRTVALFPGCLVLQRMPQYEKAAGRVLREVAVQVENIPQAACCGAPLESLDDRWLFFAAYNLSLAARMGRDMVTLCGNCTSTFLRAGAALENTALRLEVNRTLEGMGLSYEGEVEVRHLVQVLVEHLDELRQKVSRELPIKVAVTHPCQVLRPSGLARFDDPLQPQAMRRIVEAMGAEVVDYDAEQDCCGSTLYLADEKLGLEAGRRKLESAGLADVLVDACGNCHLLLERFHGLLRKSSGQGKLAVLTLPQLLGLAMGIDADELGIGPATAEALVGSSM